MSARSQLLATIHLNSRLPQRQTNHEAEGVDECCVHNSFLTNLQGPTLAR